MTAAPTRSELANDAVRGSHCGCSVLFGITVEFTNTETSPRATLPGIGKAGESPKGLGWDGHKPLMRNRTANEAPSPIGIIPATLL